MTVRIYTAEHCGPCHVVERLLNEHGNTIDGEDVTLVNVESDKGFEEFKKDILDKGDAAVPSAYKNGERCLISVENDELHLICGQDDQPSYPTELSDQPQTPEPDTA